MPLGIGACVPLCTKSVRIEELEEEFNTFCSERFRREEAKGVPWAKSKSIFRMPLDERNAWFKDFAKEKF